MQVPAVHQEVLQQQLGPEPVRIPDSLRGLPVGRAIAAAVAKRPEERAAMADELMAMLLGSVPLAFGPRRDGRHEAMQSSMRQLTVLCLRASCVHSA